MCSAFNSLISLGGCLDQWSSLSSVASAHCRESSTLQRECGWPQWNKRHPKWHVCLFCNTHGIWFTEDSHPQSLLYCPSFIWPHQCPLPRLPTDIFNLMISHRDRNLPTEVTAPSNGRFTLQWLIPDASVSEMIPNNLDAAFKKYTRKPKPSDLLLHYNYGAAALKWWGHGTNVLRKQFKPPRPITPVPAEAGPSRTAHTRTTAIRKREEAQKHGTTGKRGTTRQQSTAREPVAAPAEAGSVEEGQREQATWDEDEVMLFFWENTQAAKERHGKRFQESAQRMDSWRKGLPSV